MQFCCLGHDPKIITFDTKHTVSTRALYSNSTSYLLILWCLEAVRFGAKTVLSLWNLTDTPKNCCRETCQTVERLENSKLYLVASIFPEWPWWIMTCMFPMFTFLWHPRWRLSTNICSKLHNLVFEFCRVHGYWSHIYWYKSTQRIHSFTSSTHIQFTSEVYYLNNVLWSVKTRVTWYIRTSIPHNPVSMCERYHEWEQIISWMIQVLIACGNLVFGRCNVSIGKHW